jgi:hypothetical protein
MNYLLIRYSEDKYFTFQNHLDFYEKNKYLIFGKFGKIPKKESIDSCTYKKFTNIILYGKSGIFICKAKSFKYDLKIDELPHYYNPLMEKYSFYKKIFFIITKVKKAQNNFVLGLKIISTGNNFIETVKRSSSPMMLVSDLENK